ncbi:MAG: hypothetical protein GXO77_14825 [Calditrichaeota bacterium]|nr:hypothetical protein [Calditrichota bacterium]
MKQITLQIPDAVYEKLQESMEKSGLKSMEDFILSVLQNYLDGLDAKPSQEIDENEEIRKRLEDLGYM